MIIDSPQFVSMLQNSSYDVIQWKVIQSDTAAIMYSSGTTGSIKGVELTHRNFIAITSYAHYNKFVKDENTPFVKDENAPQLQPHHVSLLSLPLFHLFRVFMLIRATSLGQTLVLIERFDFRNLLNTVEKYKVTYMPVTLPLVVAVAKSDVVPKYDLLLHCTLYYMFYHKSYSRAGGCKKWFSKLVFN
ncbi:putative 4-coumarate--CoA ligase [Helianthus anomalus]